MKTKTFDRYSQDRRRKKLPWGHRWLSDLDVWQAGDQYDTGNGRWVTIGTGATGFKPGTRVSAEVLCYTPRGSKTRVFPVPAAKSRSVHLVLWISALHPFVCIAIIAGWIAGWNPLPVCLISAGLAVVTMLPAMAMTMKGIRRVRRESGEGF